MKHSRRQVFAVTSSLQYRFLATTLIYCFIIVCFFAIVILVPDIVNMRDESLSLEIRSSAASRLLLKNSWVWPTVFSFIFVLGLHSFLTFQKITGPLYRFRQAFDQLENGKLLPVKIRKKDYLQVEEEALNKMIKALVGKFASIKQATEEACKSIGELEQKANKGNEWSKTQIDMLHTHSKHLERLATAVQVFRLEDDEQKTAGPEHHA
jgi:methyl-accepting chemotaxis protein